MNYEKKYNDLLSRIKRMADVQPDVTRVAIESLFPELKESDDERIRKDIISYLALYKDAIGEEYESWIAWLEKQGEQKPTDMVEPKFKVGDIMRTLQEATDNITSGLPVVVSIDEEYYHCTNELIAIKDQDDYEYPPMNRRQKPTWSEEEEKIVEHLINLYKVNLKVNHYPDLEVNKKVNELKMFFKSLRPQSTWKPSDEQIEILEHFVRSIGESGYASPYDNNTKLLYSLLSDLKKLKG